jgi:hypothetical protein
MKTKTPLSVTMLVLTVLIFATWNGLRLYESILNWEILRKYNSQPGPLYLSVLSMIWLLVSLIVLIGLLKGNSRWLLLIKFTTFLFTIWYWVDRLLFQKTQISYLFPVVFTGFMILFVSTLLNHRHTHNFFKQRETHDR